MNQPMIITICTPLMQRAPLHTTHAEPDEQGQRILGNATTYMIPFNNTFVFNSWLVNPRARTRCFQVGDGGFQVLFSGTVMLHGEYGGEEGLAFANEGLFYGREYAYDFCARQGIDFQIESPDGWGIYGL